MRRPPCSDPSDRRGVPRLRDGGRTADYAQRKLLAIADRHAEAIAIAHEHGVRHRHGDRYRRIEHNDSGPLGPERSRSSATSSSAGLSALEAIEAATATAPSTLGPQAPQSGELQPGYDADVIALSGDPSVDVGILADPTNVTHVWRGGERMKAPGELGPLVTLPGIRGGSAPHRSFQVVALELSEPAQKLGAVPASSGAPHSPDVGIPGTISRRQNGPMYAIVTNVRVENPEEARLRLPEARETLLSRAPGIVSGYWLEPIEGIGTSVLVFETKEYAEEAAKYPVPPMPGVTLLDLTVREVFAHV